MRRPRFTLGLTLVLLAGLPACEPEIQNGQFACDPESIEPCPPDHACLRFGAGYRCFSSWRSICNDGELAPGEMCDSTDFGQATCRDYFPDQFPADGPDRQPVCLANCTVSCGFCGDGYVDEGLGELCDDGPGGNSDEPNASCRFDCQPRSCGDGIVDDEHDEQCDGNEALAVSCISLGFYSGMVTSCRADCWFDLAPCSQHCGDGIINGPEECDGARQDGMDCVDFGAASGRLGCDVWCQRTFDGCGAQGFQEVYRAPGEGASAIWVAADQTVFVGTGDGRVLRSSGGQWIEDSVSTDYVGALWGRSASDVWAATGDGLWHFDGTGWTSELQGNVNDV